MLQTDSSQLVLLQSAAGLSGDREDLRPLPPRAARQGRRSREALPLLRGDQLQQAAQREVGPLVFFTLVIYIYRVTHQVGPNLPLT